jgi:thiol-disulfide isomerase/thioredoxin
MTTGNADVNGLVNKLTTWTNIVLLAVAALTIGLVLYPSMAGAVASPAPPPAAYQVGATIDTPADWHQGSAFTLVLFAQSSCGACQRAQPFLKQVVEEFGDRAPLVLVSPGPDRAAEVRFGESLGLNDGMIHAAPAGIRARVTPTLVLVDRSGTVLHVWEGVPPDRQQNILESVQSATAPAN